jgi:hypothetical protein
MWQLLSGYSDILALKLPPSYKTNLPGSRSTDTQNTYGLFFGGYTYKNANDYQVHDLWIWDCEFNITIKRFLKILKKSAEVWLIK